MAYVDRFIKDGKKVSFGSKRSIATDRMGPWKNQEVTYRTVEI